ncbi:MAG TPA: C4-type zinc ribbon domain-containing protein, partial [Acidimicrobiales bacterium]
AMVDEAQSLRRRRADLEDQTLTVMEELEPVDAELAAMDEQMEALDARATDALAALAESEAVIDAETAVVVEVRAVAASRLPAELSERYERLRGRLGGIGAARLANGSCTGCHLHLPATELDRIRRAPADSVLTCDQCGRILVR